MIVLIYVNIALSVLLIFLLILCCKSFSHKTSSVTSIEIENPEKEVLEVEDAITESNMDSDEI